VPLSGYPQASFFSAANTARLVHADVKSSLDDLLRGRYPDNTPRKNRDLLWHDQSLVETSKLVLRFMEYGSMEYGICQQAVLDECGPRSPHAEG